jgi:hypothetical protein
LSHIWILSDVNYGFLSAIILPNCCRNGKYQSFIPGYSGFLQNEKASSGGYRQITVFHITTEPLFLLKIFMSTLLLSLPGGAEWIIIIGIMVVPVMLLYFVLKYSLKSAIKEAIMELKKEGQI